MDVYQNVPPLVSSSTDLDLTSVNIPPGPALVSSSDESSDTFYEMKMPLSNHWKIRPQATNEYTLPYVGNMYHGVPQLVSSSSGSGLSLGDISPCPRLVYNSDGSSDTFYEMK